MPVSNRFQVNDSTSRSLPKSAVTGIHGEFVVVWHSFGVFASNYIHGRRFGTPDFGVFVAKGDTSRPTASAPPLQGHGSR